MHPGSRYSPIVYGGVKVGHWGGGIVYLRFNGRSQLVAPCDVVQAQNGTTLRLRLFSERIVCSLERRVSQAVIEAANLGVHH